MIVDSHCHLDFKELQENFAEIMLAAKKNNISHMQTICTKISEFDKIYQIAKENKNISCSVGVHPNNVEEEGVIKAEKIIELAKLDKVIGIGETGLDYYYENSARDLQKQSFLEHIKASQTLNLPIIIHTRNAEDDTITILEKTLKEKKYPALIHCFTANYDFAKKVLDLGLYISISGIVTFKNATDIQESVKKIPLNRLLVETDSPFLAPMPKRGKSNQPAYTKYTLEFLSDLLNVPFDELAKITTDNFFQLFSKAIK